MPGKMFEVTHTEEEWRRLLTPEQYRVMRTHGTEAPGSCALDHEKRPGAFVCAGCGQRLACGIPRPLRQLALDAPDNIALRRCVTLFDSSPELVREPLQARLRLGLDGLIAFQGVRE